LFANRVDSGNRVSLRQNSHLINCPTNQQAEIMIPDSISKSGIIGVVVYSETQAKAEIARFRVLGLPEKQFNFIVCPAFFDKYALSSCIQTGSPPVEQDWEFESVDDQ
jgi:hypothetical protein